MLTWLLIPSALSAPEVGAIIRSEGAMDVAKDAADVLATGTDGRDFEDPVTVATWIRAFARSELERGDRLFIEGRLQHHFALRGGEWASAPSEGWWEFGLGETGIDARLGGTNSPVRIRAGALVERWGKLDLLPVLDVLNPRDVRTGPLVPSEWQRMPIPMTTVSVANESLRSETTIIPFPSADRLWLRETDWSPLRQGFVYGLYQQLRGWEGYDSVYGELIDQQSLALIEQDPSFRRGEDAATNTASLPQSTLVNGEIAQRFAFSGRNFDVAVVGANMRSRFPQTELDPTLQEIVRTKVLPDSDDLNDLASLSGGLPVEVSWPRTWMAGVESSGLVGPLQIRGEAGYFTHRVIRQAYGQSTTVPQLGAGLGVDYIRGSTLQVALEARLQHLIEPPNNLVMSAPDQVQIAAGMRAGFAAERLWLTIGGAYDVAFSELFAKPSLAWRPSDHVQLELGVLLLEGFATDPPEDLLDVLTYEGGPASFWSENDAVTLAVVFIL